MKQYWGEIFWGTLSRFEEMKPNHKLQTFLTNSLHQHAVSPLIAEVCFLSNDCNYTTLWPQMKDNNACKTSSSSPKAKMSSKQSYKDHLWTCSIRMLYNCMCLSGLRCTTLVSSATLCTLFVLQAVSAVRLLIVCTNPLLCDKLSLFLSFCTVSLQHIPSDWHASTRPNPNLLAFV